MALRLEGGVTARPLQTLSLRGAKGATSVADSTGRVYFRAQGADKLLFVVGGALGTHTITDEAESLPFDVVAETAIDDGGFWRDGFDLAVRSMRGGFGRRTETGVGSDIYDGKAYRWYVMWQLDQAMVAAGMRYFDGAIREFVDLHALGQREDGMIWSFHEPDNGPQYYETFYGPLGFCRSKGGLRWVRQPAENHPESYFVRCLIQAWQATGDDEWARGKVDHAIRALDFAASDPLRWNAERGLLVRPYTIDMWDFQADDPYLPPSLGSAKMMVTPGVTKMTVFHGDNTLFARVSRELAALLDRLGRPVDAARIRTRGDDVLARTLALAWSGDNWIHKVELEEGIERDLSDVPESERLSYSSALSLTRGLDGARAGKILDRYERLRDARPDGSPGESYFMYPPYDRGFSGDAERWEYMNGGVSPAVAGALARGAFAHGRAAYGVDVLRRTLELGKAEGRLHWGWRGATGEPDRQGPYRTIDISRSARMALSAPAPKGRRPWMDETLPGNDLAGFPEGPIERDGVPFAPVGDAVALSERPTWDAEFAVTTSGRWGSVSILHTAGTIGEDGAIGYVTWRYVDGTERTVPVLKSRHGDGWWFPSLTSEEGSIAWSGPSGLSASVGAYAATLDNPSPEKIVASIRFRAAPTGAKWAILAVTLSESRRPRKPNKTTGGGPENWPPASMVHAMVEGLAGVTDEATRFSRVRLTPRWGAAGADDVAVTVRYGASDGYVAYRFRRTGGETETTLTGSGERVAVRIPWPDGDARATVDGAPAPSRIEEREDGRHAVVEVDPRTPVRIVVRPA